jgi:hypothetical protein
MQAKKSHGDGGEGDMAAKDQVTHTIADAAEALQCQRP